MENGCWDLTVLQWMDVTEKWRKQIARERQEQFPNSHFLLGCLYSFVHAS